MNRTRKALLKKLEEMRDSKVLLYVTSDRPGWETQIDSTAVDWFVTHLDQIGDVKKISLVLYTTGGQILAAYSLVNLVRQFCDKFEVIVPNKCRSAGTLICLGASKIVMTKQATLGPVDPSVNGMLAPSANPNDPNSPRHPVSVEALQGYIDLARENLKIRRQSELAQLLINLSHQVHPLMLGEVFRAKKQISDLVRKLMKHSAKSDDQVNKIERFLTSESGSHDYAINRGEGRELGLEIEKPNADLYKLIKEINDNFSQEMGLTETTGWDNFLGEASNKEYSICRALIESTESNSVQFRSSGRVSKVDINTDLGTKIGFQDARQHEGWFKIESDY